MFACMPDIYHTGNVAFHGAPVLSRRWQQCAGERTLAAADADRPAGAALVPPCPYSQSSLGRATWPRLDLLPPGQAQHTPAQQWRSSDAAMMSHPLASQCKEHSRGLRTSERARCGATKARPQMSPATAQTLSMAATALPIAVQTRSAGLCLWRGSLASTCWRACRKARRRTARRRRGASATPQRRGHAATRYRPGVWPRSRLGHQSSSERVASPPVCRRKACLSRVQHVLACRHPLRCQPQQITRPRS